MTHQLHLFARVDSGPGPRCRKRKTREIMRPMSLAERRSLRDIQRDGQPGGGGARERDFGTGKGSASMGGRG